MRRARRLAFGLSLAALFAFGARNYVATMRHHPCPYGAEIALAEPRTVRLDLASDPPGATVVRELDGRRLCQTPCTVGMEARPVTTAFRFVMPGHESRRMPVNLAGGDTQIEAVLQPIP